MLLGKIIFYDQQLSVKRNESCSFCHMPETGFSGPVSALNQTTWPILAPFGPASMHETLNPIPTRVTRLFFITIRSKVILSAASSGICTPRGCAWTARSPSRHKILPLTQPRWV
jgi:hypothetical protein